MPSASVVKIAVEGPSKEHQSRLLEFDQRRPLESLIVELCRCWGIHDENPQQIYALQFSETDNRLTSKAVYVTDRNITDITNGAILKLGYAPIKAAADIIKDIRSNSSALERQRSIKLLLRFSMDPIFAEEFFKQDGFPLLIQYLGIQLSARFSLSSDKEVMALNDLELVNLGTAMQIVIELMSHQIVQWDLLDTDFVQKIVNYIGHIAARKSSPSPENSAAGSMMSLSMSQQQIATVNSINYKITLNTLNILECIVQNASRKHSAVIENLLPIAMDLIHSNFNRMELLQDAIALINSLLMKSNRDKRHAMADLISARQFRSIILAAILNTPKTNTGSRPASYERNSVDMSAMIKNGLGTELEHQLHVFQSLLLGLHDERAQLVPRKNSTLSSEATEKILEIRRIAFDNESVIGTSDISNKRGQFFLGNTAQVGYVDDYKRLGYTNHNNPMEDFNESPPGLLALDLIYYFAQNHQDKFIKFILENCCRQGLDHSCPLIRGSIQLAKDLCDILHIGEPPTDEGRLFYPMFFTHNYPLEELFCICIQLLNKTWKEMRATVNDFDKVFRVLNQQIAQTLDDFEATMSYERFRLKLARLNYHEITLMWQKEQTNKEGWASNTRLISELRDHVHPEILSLVRRHRLQRLVEGERFLKYSSKGQRIKDKFWFCRLSNNLKALFYDDCNENKRPTTDELSHKLLVSDIKKLVVGRECPHMKDNKSKRSTLGLAFSLLHDSDEDGCLNFVASDEKIFCHWTDGLNALLQNEMTSSEVQRDFEILSQIEIKLKLLDIESTKLNDSISCDVSQER